MDERVRGQLAAPDVPRADREMTNDQLSVTQEPKKRDGEFHAKREVVHTAAFRVTHGSRYKLGADLVRSKRNASMRIGDAAAHGDVVMTVLVHHRPQQSTWKERNRTGQVATSAFLVTGGPCWSRTVFTLAAPVHRDDLTRWWRGARRHFAHTAGQRQ